MKARYQQYLLNFKKPSGTSRGILTQKETWFIILEDESGIGIGECGILRTLSIDDRPDYEEKLKWTCENIHLGKEVLWECLIEFPSIQFGLEMAFESLSSDDPFILFPSEFTNGNESIPINGLVWMGEPHYMQQQIEEKLTNGYRCIKLKIGAIDFAKELELLRYIRRNFNESAIEIRVDANGAFEKEEAFEKLRQLSEFNLHSIEQPIAPQQTEFMADLCSKTPFPIALDEELIGVFNKSDKEELLQKIKPQYIILKPSLIGGFKGTQQWIDLAEEMKIGWWITSALESNIGLNAIAQWTFLKNVKLPQGLGTGSLYTNNIDCPLEVNKGYIGYNPSGKWNITSLNID